MNLLEIGKVLKVHGIKGAVKVESYVLESFKMFKHVYITNNKLSVNITEVKNLNNNCYSVSLDIIPDIDTAEKYKNASLYIDRDEYPYFKKIVYLSDLINKPVIDENNNEIGLLVDFEEYGSRTVLSIKCGAVSFDIPYVEDIISLDRETGLLKMNRQRFEDLKIWK